MAQPAPSAPPSGPLEGVDEATWMDVIHRMDEVYSKLIADEVALEQKNTELEQSHQFIYSVLSSMSDLVIACGEEGEIEETNAALTELVGRAEDSLRGQRLDQLLLSAEDRQRLRRMTDWSTNAKDAREAVELHLRDAHGQDVPVEVRCTPRRDGAGVRVGYVLVGRPVGELRRAYQQLQEAHAALKSAQQQLLHSEKMASLGRLVAGVAHELNNPISFVLGNVHALGRYCRRLTDYLAAVDGGASPSDLKVLREQLKIDHVVADMPGLIEGTQEGAQRTAEIVAGLKRFSALDRGETQLVEISPIIERAIHWVCKGTSPAFQVHWVPCSGLQVQGSAGHLLQVFMNLIQNAYDATVGADVAQPALWIDAEVRGARLHMRFADNGPGIAEALRSRVFDPFFTTKPVGKGTGLGLSISYGIVEQHGGSLAVQVAPQGGAAFLVDLPLAAASLPSEGA